MGLIEKRLGRAVAAASLAHLSQATPYQVVVGEIRQGSNCELADLQ